MKQILFILFMLTNPGTHPSVRKISDDNNQENRQWIIEEKDSRQSSYTCF